MEAVVKVWALDDALARSGNPITIAGPDAGTEGVVLADGLEGLLDPPSDAYKKSPGGRPGTRLVSTRFPERPVTFKVTVLGDGSSWSAADAAWRSVWFYDWWTEIEVTTERSGSRSLFVRLSEIEVDTRVDPHIQGATDVVMTVEADDPFFYLTKGTPAHKAMHKSIAANGSATFSWGSSPVFRVFPTFDVTAASSEGSITLKYSDAAGASVTNTVTLPVLLTGHSYKVSTDPGARQIYSATDKPVWGRMNGVRFNPKAPRRATSVTITNKTAASITAHVDPPFLRAW